ncbi:MAG: PA3496 family putative envelope integrity protein [Porticoccaceae bacterium]
MSEEDFDTGSDTPESDVERNVSNAAAERARAQLSLEARRRLEAKLEESRLRRQIGEYDYDMD